MARTSTMVILAMLSAGSMAARAQIVLPPPPRSIPPQSPPASPEIRDDSSDSMEEQLRVKRRERRTRETKKTEQEAIPKEPRKIALRNEALAERPMRLMLETSAVLPRIIARGRSHDFNADMTSHFHLFWRPGNSPPDRTAFWTGFRLAPFAGSGWDEDVPGRFGFLYFGPIVAVGSFSPAALGRNSGATGREDGSPEGDYGLAGARDSLASLSTAILPKRRGWFLAGGMSAVSRIARTGRPVENPGADFTSTGAALDPPGLWTEARFTTVFYGGLTTSMFAGAQRGAGKTFLWVGLGVGGVL